MPWYDWFPYEANNPKSPQYGPYLVELKAGKKYSWCSCGESKIQPWCDGSHKNLPQPNNFKPVRFQNGFHSHKGGNTLAALCGCKHAETAPWCNNTHWLVRAHKMPGQHGAMLFGATFAASALLSWVTHP